MLVPVPGALGESNLAVFAETIADAFGVAAHVVVDLGRGTALPQAGVRVLLDLDRATTRRGLSST